MSRKDNIMSQDCTLECILRKRRQKVLLAIASLYGLTQVSSLEPILSKGDNCKGKQGNDMFPEKMTAHEILC